MTHRAALVLLLTIGCDRTEPTPEPAAATAATTSEVTATAAPAASPEPAPDPKVAALETMKAFVAAASEKGIALKDSKIHDEESDPNKLLGRPGQYLAKVNWTIDGNDATIEVFASAEDAKARADYVEKIGKSSPLFLEYIYVHPKRHAVLRVPKQLTPTKAKEWEAMLLTL